jgi:(aminoalkyl)phosphonate N-acetyltransferase
VVTIRPANGQDARRVHALIESLEEGQRFEFGPFRQKYMQNLRDPSLVYLVADDGGDAVAFGSLAFLSPLHHAEPVAEIVELIVDEAFRGQAVGERLVAEMKARAAGRGCGTLEVASNLARQRAHRFYARLGFKMTHCKLTMAMR